jgi:hypothetical protein
MSNGYSAQPGGFVAGDVKIGRGMKPLAQHGQVRVENGQLILVDSHGTVIDQGPITMVAAKAPWYTMRNGVWVTVNGTRYFLAFNAQVSLTNAMPADRVLNGRRGTKQFLKALDAARNQA